MVCLCWSVGITSQNRQSYYYTYFNTDLLYVYYQQNPTTFRPPQSIAGKTDIIHSKHIDNTIQINKMLTQDSVIR